MLFLVLLYIHSFLLVRYVSVVDVLFPFCSLCGYIWFQFCVCDYGFVSFVSLRFFCLLWFCGFFVVPLCFLLVTCCLCCCYLLFICCLLCVFRWFLCCLLLCLLLAYCIVAFLLLIYVSAVYLLFPLCLFIWLLLVSVLRVVIIFRLLCLCLLPLFLVCFGFVSFVSCVFHLSSFLCFLS